MRRRLSQAVPLLLLLGCSQTAVVGPGSGPGDAGATLDQGAADLAMPLVCGGTTCEADAEQCCAIPNCETGMDDLICPFGAFNCPDVEDCPPRGPCDPFDARGEGVCALGLGVAWNGTTCEFLSGCECAGADCGELYVDMLACLRAHAACERDCGAEPACDARSYCEYWADGCGAAGDGTCVPRPRDCPDIFAPVCACDGVTYDNACAAQGAGQDVFREGEC